MVVVSKLLMIRPKVSHVTDKILWYLLAKCPRVSAVKLQKAQYAAVFLCYIQRQLYFGTAVGASEVFSRYCHTKLKCILVDVFSPFRDCKTF